MPDEMAYAYDKLPDMSDVRAISDKIRAKIETAAKANVPEVSAWLSRRVASRWYPRNREAARDFVIKTAGDRPFYLYGAGSHSLDLLDDLAGHPVLRQLLGFLDGHAKPNQTLQGYAVSPKALALENDQLIILSHHEFEDGMLRDLLALGVAPERIRPIYSDPDYGEMVLARLLPELDDQAMKQGSAPSRVIFVNARKRRMVDGRAISSTEQQFINISMERGGASVSQAGFNACFDAHNSLFLCCYLLAVLDPDLVVVQEHYSSGNFLPLVLGLFLPPQKIVAEFYDFLALTFDDPHILAQESYWAHEDVELALASERWCSQHIGGFITKEDGPVFDRWLSHPRVLKYQPCLSQNMFLNKQGRPGQPARLIWAGTIASSRLSPIMFGDNQLLDVFEDLLAAGLEVTARTSCRDQAELEAHYDDYLELARHKRFQILPAIPIEKLIPEMATTRDFGLMLGRPKPNTQQGISHKVTVSAKMHAYLAAGLPIIVGDYLEIMADWVRQNGIGLVVSPDHLATLPKLIEQADYEAMCQAVKQYRQSFHQEAMSQKLQQFLDQLIHCQ